MNITGYYIQDGILYMPNGIPHPNPGMLPGNIYDQIPVIKSINSTSPSLFRNPVQAPGTYKPTYKPTATPGTPISTGTSTQGAAAKVTNLFKTHKTTILIGISALIILTILYIKFRK